MPTLHIDADSLVYAIGFACQDKDTKEVAPLENVLHSVKLSVKSIVDKFPEYDYQLHLTTGTCFRHDLYTEYKANRVADKPLLYHVIRDYLVGRWGAIVHEGIEADDAVAIALTQDSSSVCVSGDKDLQTVAGLHLHPKRLDEGLYTVNEVEAAMNFYTQVLTGDVSDNVPGVKELPLDIKDKYKLGKRRGVGPATATKILGGVEDPIEMFSRVRECYQDDDRLLLMGRLLHMTRELTDEGKPILWELPL